MRGHESKKARGGEANTPSVEENRAVETLAAFFRACSPPPPLLPLFQVYCVV